jgi:hypothetical protein
VGLVQVGEVVPRWVGGQGPCRALAPGLPPAAASARAWGTLAAQAVGRAQAVGQARAWGTLAAQAVGQARAWGTLAAPAVGRAQAVGQARAWGTLAAQAWELAAAAEQIAVSERRSMAQVVEFALVPPVALQHEEPEQGMQRARADKGPEAQEGVRTVVLVPVPCWPAGRAVKRTQAEVPHCTFAGEQAAGQRAGALVPELLEHCKVGERALATSLVAQLVLLEERRNQPALKAQAAAPQRMAVVQGQGQLQAAHRTRTTAVQAPLLVVARREEARRLPLRPRETELVAVVSVRAAGLRTDVARFGGSLTESRSE